MPFYDFETELVRHCAPTIMGIKPANLISFAKSRWSNIHDLYKKYEKIFREYNIHMKVVCSCKKHFIVLIYRVDLMETYFQKKDIRRFLDAQGYEQCKSCVECIDKLAFKYGENQECPHELGIFLGYPLEDVKGFIRYKGFQYKCSGLWKVYDDVSYAMNVFARYKKCTEYAQNAMANGYGITQILDQKEMLFEGGY